MIKIGLRHNLIYLLMLIIFNFARKIDSIIMDQLLKFDSSLLLTLIMFLSEFITGCILFVYENSSFSRKQKNKTNNTFMGIELIRETSSLLLPDSTFKIILLLFMASYFDFVNFMLSTFYLPKFKEISRTLEMRLSSIIIIFSAFFFIFLLKFPIFRHQFFSLSIIVICLIIIIILEFIFQVLIQEKSFGRFGLLLLLIFVMHFFDSLLDSIEKYLLEYDFLNPFKTLMMEGIFGTILTSIYSITENPFKEIKEYYNDKEKEKDNISFIFLIVCLFFYFFLSGGRNAYRVVTNKIYSPMTKSLTDYCLNPILIIFYFIYEGDFEANSKKQIIFFIFNLILSIIIVFSSLVYNELLILVCYKLDYDTYQAVAKRAKTRESFPRQSFEMDINQDDDELDDEKLNLN